MFHIVSSRKLDLFIRALVRYTKSHSCSGRNYTDAPRTSCFRRYHIVSKKNKILLLHTCIWCFVINCYP